VRRRWRRDAADSNHADAGADVDAHNSTAVRDLSNERSFAAECRLLQRHG
jgi:hypothetical protein